MTQEGPPACRSKLAAVAPQAVLTTPPLVGLACAALNTKPISAIGTGVAITSTVFTTSLTTSFSTTTVSPGTSTSLTTSFSTTTVSPGTSTSLTTSFSTTTVSPGTSTSLTTSLSTTTVSPGTSTSLTTSFSTTTVSPGTSLTSVQAERRVKSNASPAVMVAKRSPRVLCILLPPCGFKSDPRLRVTRSRM